jgi:ankyrin repeat protein
MESHRAPGNHEDEALSCEIQSQPKLAGHFRELTGPGHRYENTTARDNARVQYGDQYHHYYAVPAREFTAREVEAQRLEELLEALAFPQMNFRFVAITNAYSSTCQWLFETPEYTRWRDRSLLQTHHGLLWMKGKPGSGKSTITKCAVDYAEKTFTDEKTIYFFFNARGDPLEKTVEGMLRSLLHQMVRYLPRLFGALEPKEVAAYSQGWPSKRLSGLFHEAVCELSKDGQLCCYIDGLDEADEDEVREMVDFLDELLEHTMRKGFSFSVYLASRHYPNISVSHSEELLLDDYEGHHRDISSYVLSKLRCKPASVQIDLAAEIMRRSSGIFLWVVMVIRDLNKQSDRGNHHRLRSHLQALPSGLNELFQRLVCGTSMSEYALPALQTVLFAHRALGPLELYFAILTITDTSSKHSIDWDHNTIDEEVATDFITSSSKGLLEVVIEDEGPAYRIRRRSVQFIHESVREYLLSCGMKHLDPSLGENLVGQGNSRLARCCRVYLDLGLQYVVIPQLKTSRFCRGDTLLASFPFFSYAWDGVLLHSEAAAYHGITIQDPFKMLLQWHLQLCWERKHWGRSWDRLCLLKSTPTVLHVFAHAQCTSLILQELKRCPRHHLRNYINADCPGGYPGMHVRDRMNRTALQIAIVKQFPEIVELLLDYGADVNVSHRKGDDHPLHIVTSDQRLRQHGTLEMLLGHGAEPNVKNDSGQTALHNEAESGSIEVVRLLLEYGADPNARDHFHRTPLHMAVFHFDESFALVRTLLRHGADLHTRDVFGGTAIQKAVRRENADVCKLLLEHGAEVNTRNPRGETLLHQAARGCRGSDISYLLLQSNADVDARDRDKHTPLRFAIEQNNIEIVEALLIHGAEVSSLYTRVRGSGCFMESLSHYTPGFKTRVILRLVAYCKDISLAARFQVRFALKRITADEEEAEMPQIHAIRPDLPGRRPALSILVINR